jgi:hypothetical protein
MFHRIKLEEERATEIVVFLVRIDLESDSFDLVKLIIIVVSHEGSPSPVSPT